MDDQEFINHYRKLWPVTKLEIKMLLAVVLVVVMGFLQSFQYSDWQYIERAGALIVLIGISLVKRDASTAVAKSTATARAVLKDRIQTLTEQSPKGLLKKALANSEVTRMKEKIDRLPEFEETLTNRVRTTEAILFTLGTLVWAYGSPVFTFIYSFKS